MIYDMTQATSSEWHDQWSRFEDREESLFTRWIAPRTLADFTGREVLEGGCGGGQHTAILRRSAAHVTAVDLNTTDIARRRNEGAENVEFYTADLATMELGRSFDVVLSIGVVHHTDDPQRTFENLYRHCLPGGLVVLWVYSAEGNFLMRHLVEPLRRTVLRHLPRGMVAALARLATLALYPLVHTLYRMPLPVLPYYAYFRSFRRLPFERNVLNVFDKLNAPQTRFLSLATCKRWFSADRFIADSISIRHHDGVSYALSGIKLDGR